MNRVGFSKSSSNSKSKKDKKGQKRKYEKDSSISHKSKKMKRIRQKSRKSSRHLHEYAEYECSRMDLGRAPRHIQRIPSDSSVIYVKTFPQKDIPVIDLTKSSHNILYSSVSSRFPSSTSLKLIYKSSNFNSRLPKHLTSSLLTIPLSRSVERTRNINSTSNLSRCSKERLAILDIPPEFYDVDTDGSEYAFYDLSKADLNEEDRSMIECITMNEGDNDSSYNLESKQPIENMCGLYGVTSEDNFD